MHSYYRTMYEVYSELERHMRKIEKEIAHQRSVVCSIPEAEIRPSSIDIPSTDWWKPG